MIDLSHWDSLPKGAYRAYAKAGNWVWMLKASEGVNFKDPSFWVHYENLKKECDGMPLEIGAYHVLNIKPSQKPSEEVHNFLSAIDGRAIKYYAIDMETYPQDLQYLDVLVAILADVTGVTPILYGSADLLTKLAQEAWIGAALVRACPLWVARYSDKRPTQFDRLWAWQYTNSYSIEGLPPVDRSVLVDAKQWVRFK